jgi:molybdopterin-guanine dinucleotide biosynthesis protein A
MLDIEGFILTGGASSRMGANKARLSLAGRTFTSRISDALSTIAARTSVVGANGDDDAQLPVIPDVYRQWGALGGVHAALNACRAEWAAIVACDLPFVSAELLARLVALRANFAAVAPVQEDARPQPLCALYRVTACLNRAQALIEAGERRPRALLEDVQTRWVACEELSDLTNAARLFLNVNTPEDYARAQHVVSNSSH